MKIITEKRKQNKFCHGKNSKKPKSLTVFVYKFEFGFAIQTGW